LESITILGPWAKAELAYSEMMPQEKNSLINDMTNRLGWVKIPNFNGNTQIRRALIRFGSEPLISPVFDILFENELGVRKPEKRLPKLNMKN